MGVTVSDFDIVWTYINGENFQRKVKIEEKQTNK